MDKVKRMDVNDFSTILGNVDVEQIHETARIFAEAPRSIIICGEGILRQTNGYQHMLHLIDLTWVTGKLGKSGC